MTTVRGVIIHINPSREQNKWRLNSTATHEWNYSDRLCVLVIFMRGWTQRTGLCLTGDLEASSHDGWSVHVQKPSSRRGELAAQRDTQKKTEVVKADTQSLLLKLTSHLAQMNSDTNRLGGGRQRDTLWRSGPQTVMSSNTSMPNLQVCAEFLHFFIFWGG